MLIIYYSSPPVLYTEVIALILLQHSFTMKPTSFELVISAGVLFLYFFYPLKLFSLLLIIS